MRLAGKRTQLRYRHSCTRQRRPGAGDTLHFQFSLANHQFTLKHRNECNKAWGSTSARCMRVTYFYICVF